MKRTKITVFISQEVHTLLLDLWHKKRRKDRKTTMDDIVEDALKQYKDSNGAQL